jgi:glycosyltransferase involved in cell wall biosynthesis/ribosomal protein S18 acetylase RimI-like enzyme
MSGHANGPRSGERRRVAHITTVDVTLRFLLIEQLERLQSEGYEVTAVSSPGPWLEDLERLGVRTIEWRNATRAWSPSKDVAALVELVRILRRERFHIVHTHNPKPGLMGRIAARVARVPVVVNTVHGFYATPDDPFTKRASIMALECAASRLSHAELFQSREDLAWAARRWIGTSRTRHYLGNGIDVRHFSTDRVPEDRSVAVRAALGISPEQLVVGTVGRLVREKGYVEFIEAARSIRSTRDDVIFLAVGPRDPDKPDALTQADIDAASADVKFLGFRDDVRDLLSIMDVFVLPSWREGVPRSAIEAASMSRAMVLTDIRGCREIAGPGSEALFVPPRAPRALTGSIASLLKDPERRARLGAAARAKVVEEFDERLVASRLAAIYRDLIRAADPDGRQVDVEGLRDVSIRAARLTDVRAMAAMHGAVMTKAFMPALGQPFLRWFFRALVEDPASPTFVAVRDGTVIGYTSGSLSVPEFRRRFIRRYGVPALVSAVPRLIRPSILRRSWELFRYPETTAGLPVAEHTLIGVAPGTAPGLGMELTREALSALTALGAREIKCYVSVENQAMRHVVRRAGFEPTREIRLHDGVRSLVCVYRCPS